jgi:S-(hydroxymethyl)glutathione dehydrogenase / alcohol dehydrogenase
VLRRGSFAAGLYCQRFVEPPTIKEARVKAAVLNGFDGVFDVEDLRIANPVGREVMVDVKASGLCRSDLHLAQHGFGFPVPGVLGHEVAGVVTEIGPDVTQCTVGDHVVGSLIQYCGACAACLDGRTYQCAHPEATLRSADQPGRLTRYGATVHQIYGLGAFAEQVLAHENQLTPIPAEVPFAQAAVLGCATITGAGAALNTARVRPGDTVAVVGVGGVGLNVISGAVLAGAERIIAIDVGAPKLVLARRFGATDTINSTEVEPDAALRKIVPLGVDHAFEAVGLKQTSELAVKLTRVGGGAYLIGVHRPGSTIELEVVGDLLACQRRVQGVHMGSTNPKRDIPMYAELYRQRRLNLDELISTEIRLDDINNAYRQLVERPDIARMVITRF